MTTDPQTPVEELERAKPELLVSLFLAFMAWALIGLRLVGVLPRLLVIQASLSSAAVSLAAPAICRAALRAVRDE